MHGVSSIDMSDRFPLSLNARPPPFRLRMSVSGLPVAAPLETRPPTHRGKEARVNAIRSPTALPATPASGTMRRRRGGSSACRSRKGVRGKRLPVLLLLRELQTMKRLDLHRPRVQHPLVGADARRSVSAFWNATRSFSCCGVRKLVAPCASTPEASRRLRPRPACMQSSSRGVTRPHDVEQRVRAAVVQVRRRVPEVVQHRRDVVAERPRLPGMVRVSGGLPGFWKVWFAMRHGQRVGLVEQVRRADVVPDERVVAIRRRRATRGRSRCSASCR